MSKLLGACTLLTACTLIAACTRSADPEHAGGSSTAREAMLVRGGGPDPDSLDPQKARGFEAQSIVRDLCEGLTTLARDGGVAPGVATGWNVSGDGLTYRFDLRRDARWSNGDRVVAADFVAGLIRLVDQATGSGYAQYIDVIAMRATSSPDTSRTMRSGWQRPMMRLWSSGSPRRPRTCRRCCRTRAPVRCTVRPSCITRTATRAPGSWCPTEPSC